MINATAHTFLVPLPVQITNCIYITLSMISSPAPLIHTVSSSINHSLYNHVPLTTK